ncbi:glucokinase [Caulobacter segnis]|uniref:Glucokinase n=3 Tax=Caulobacter segnis TaxID=88688 RepID=D5VPH8_CAUST|nr:glucokinase [Caulobacter segnis]ADG12401.1 Glucokinase [Caulobacter segnis ATCC 21756]AVQ03986.1 glucokinase [Caulobacter segnis]
MIVSQEKTAYALVADVDGEKARIGLAEPGRAPVDVGVVDCDSQEALIEILSRALAEAPGPILGVAIAAPGPSLNGAIKLTHAPMRLVAESIAAGLGIHRLRLVNDFTARALAVPLLDHGALESIGAGAPHRDAPAGAIGPSETGVGMSILYPDGFVGWTAAAAEGGHADLAAASDREAAVIRLLRDTYGHVSADKVLCGNGLLDVALALSTLAGAPARPDNAQALIAAAEREEPVARETFALVSAWLGAVCGNLVLTVGARSGIYIISATVLSWGRHLDRQILRRRFEAKGQMADYMRDVPLYLVNDPNCGLLGLSTLFS